MQAPNQESESQSLVVCESAGERGDAAMRFTIPEALPSLNQTLRQHWASRAKDHERWGKMIAIARVRSMLSTAYGKRRVTIERHGKRALDADNAAGGAKGFIDELRAFKLLVDDSPRWMELVTVHVPLAKGEKPYTVVILEEVGDDNG